MFDFHSPFAKLCAAVIKGKIGLVILFANTIQANETTIKVSNIKVAVRRLPSLILLMKSSSGIITEISHLSSFLSIGLT